MIPYFFLALGIILVIPSATFFSIYFYKEVMLQLNGRKYDEARIHNTCLASLPFLAVGLFIIFLCLMVP